MVKRKLEGENVNLVFLKRKERFSRENVKEREVTTMDQGIYNYTFIEIVNFD